jgi:hypothetical protein
MPLHLLKMCVGCDSVEDLQQWQSERLARGEPLVHRTRNRPRRAAESLAGGALYWIIRGAIQVRQRILSLDASEEEGRLFCRIGLDPALIRTVPTAHRPMQGWRYLDPGDVPPDRAAGDSGAVPPEMMRELRALGLL